MIYLKDTSNDLSGYISRLIELVYLQDRFSDSIAKSNILINPDKADYIYGKLIIFNLQERINHDLVSTLLSHGCKIISRIPVNGEPDINYQPYILRVDKNVMWNGEILDRTEYDNDTHENILGILGKTEKYKLDLVHGQNIFYSPKILINKNEDHNYIDVLDWLLIQTGLGEKEYSDFDLVKSGKFIPRSLYIEENV